MQKDALSVPLLTAGTGHLTEQLTKACLGPRLEGTDHGAAGSGNDGCLLLTLGGSRDSLLQGGASCTQC